MKHIREAKKLVDEGNGSAALGVIDYLLELAPKNPEALRLKAKILDAWGYFDKSLEILRRLSLIDDNDADTQQVLENRLQEEREAIIFSELTADGRWYFAFPKSQVWVSLVGFLGCALFLLLSTHWLENSTQYFIELMSSFFFLVIVPWIVLMFVHFSGVKRILVGIEGVKICYRFKETMLSWRNISAAVIEYDVNLSEGYLQLFLYSNNNSKEPLIKMDISYNNPVVRARRHFVRSILSYVNCVVYRARNVLPGEEVEIVSPIEVDNGKQQAA